MPSKPRPNPLDNQKKSGTIRFKSTNHMPNSDQIIKTSIALKKQTSQSKITKTASKYIETRISSPYQKQKNKNINNKCKIDDRPYSPLETQKIKMFKDKYIQKQSNHLNIRSINDKVKKNIAPVKDKIQLQSKNIYLNKKNFAYKKQQQKKTQNYRQLTEQRKKNMKNVEQLTIVSKQMRKNIENQQDFTQIKQNTKIQSLKQPRVLQLFIKQQKLPVNKQDDTNKKPMIKSIQKMSFQESLTYIEESLQNKDLSLNDQQKLEDLFKNCITILQGKTPKTHRDFQSLAFLYSSILTLPKFQTLQSITKYVHLALSIYDTNQGRFYQEKIVLLNNAAIHLEEQHPKESQQIYDKLIALEESYLPKNDQRYIITLNNYAELCCRMKQKQKGKKMLQKCLDMLKKGSILQIQILKNKQKFFKKND